MHKYSIFLFFSLLFCNIILAQTSEEVKVINLLLYNGIRTRDNHNVFLLSKKKASLFENELQLNEFQRYLRADSIDIDIRLFEALRVDTATEYWYHVLGDNKDKRQSEALILDTTTTIFWDRTNYIISQNAIGQNLIYSSKKKTKIIKKGYGKNINKIMNSKPYVLFKMSRPYFLGDNSYCIIFLSWSSNIANGKRCHYLLRRYSFEWRIYKEINYKEI